MYRKMKKTEDLATTRELDSRHDTPKQSVSGTIVLLFGLNSSKANDPTDADAPSLSSRNKTTRVVRTHDEGIWALTLKRETSKGL